MDNNVKNSCSLPGLIIMFLVASLGAVAVGTVAHILGVKSYYVLLFPLLMGIGMRGFSTLSVNLASCKNLSMALTVSLFAGILAYGSMHYEDYRTFSNSVSSMMISNEPDIVTKEQAVASINNSLKETVGVGGFVGFMKYRASEGLTVEQATGSSFAIAGPGMVLNWTFELLLIVGLTLSGATVAVRRLNGDTEERGTAAYPAPEDAPARLKKMKFASWTPSALGFKKTLQGKKKNLVS